MARRVLIGGGTGFIGQRLGELLRLSRYETINISRMPGSENIDWHAIEISGIPKNTIAVVNCAGQQFMDFTKLWTPGFKQNVQNSRVFTTQALATAINKAQTPPKAFVVVTGVGAYEPSEHQRYDEDSPIKGDDFFSALCKEWEAAANEAQPPVRVVTIRAGVVLGRWGGMIKNMFLPFYLGLGGRIGSGKQYLPWIHIDDLVRLIQYAIENDEIHGVLNGVAPQVITNQEFTKAFANALNRPAVLPIPEFALNFLLHPERAKILTTGQYVVPKRAFAKALSRPAFLPVPEVMLNMLLDPERAMVMTKGQHVTPKRVRNFGFKYNFPTIDEACKDVAHLMLKRKAISIN